MLLILKSASRIRIQEPILPSKDEVSEPELIHLQYLSWCLHHLRARSRTVAHKK